MKNKLRFPTNTKASYYYRLRRVRHACLENIPGGSAASADRSCELWNPADA